MSTPASKIVPFPGMRPGGRAPFPATVRFGHPRQARQMRLPLARAEDTLDQRIQAARETCAWHEDRLREATKREAKERQLRAVTFWNQRILDLIAERDRATAQPSLLP